MHQQRWFCFPNKVSWNGQHIPCCSCERQEWEKMRKNLQTLRSGEKEGRCASSTGVGIPLQPIEDYVGEHINTIGHRHLHTTEKYVLMEAVDCGKSIQENAKRSPSGSVFPHKIYSQCEAHVGAVCSWRTVLQGNDPYWSCYWCRI